MQVPDSVPHLYPLLYQPQSPVVVLEATLGKLVEEFVSSFFPGTLSLRLTTSATYIMGRSYNPRPGVRSGDTLEFTREPLNEVRLASCLNPIQVHCSSGGSMIEMLLSSTVPITTKRWDISKLRLPES